MALLTYIRRCNKKDFLKKRFFFENLRNQVKNLKNFDTSINALHNCNKQKKPGHTQYRNIRNYTQILENLRKAIVGCFGLRNKFENVQGNKKLNTQNIQV